MWMRVVKIKQTVKKSISPPNHHIHYLAYTLFSQQFFFLESSFGLGFGLPYKYVGTKKLCFSLFPFPL